MTEKPKKKAINKEQETKISSVEKLLSYTFKKKDLILLALTHRSYTNQLKKQGENYNNERIEFLGDAVLELVVSEYLYKEYPDFPEGILTLVRSTVVRTSSLSTALEKIGVQDSIIMGKGEEKSGGKNKPYILANTYEAIVGAIYLDGGYKAASKFIFDTLKEYIHHVVDNKKFMDPKTQLQEIVQSHFKITPFYTIIHESGPAHEKEYIAAVHVGEKKLSEGKGSSKQKAEETAAEKALEILDKLINKTNA